MIVTPLVIIALGCAIIVGLVIGIRSHQRRSTRLTPITPTARESGRTRCKHGVLLTDECSDCHSNSGTR